MVSLALIVAVPASADWADEVKKALGFEEDIPVQDFRGTWISPYPQGNTLYAVWGSSGADVFAVGYVGTIIHYDGSSWTVMESGTKEALWSVWGASGSDVFAVGSNGTILHYDGSTWTKMDSPTTEQLNGVWAASSSDVFVVGRSGTILHYDGSSWSTMKRGTDRYLGIWGFSGDDVYAVGIFGLIYHYDGTSWTLHGDVDGDGITVRVDGIWGSSSSDMYAVGWDTIGPKPNMYHLTALYGGPCLAYQILL